MLAYILVTNTIPYPTVNLVKLAQGIVDGDRPPIPCYVDPFFQHLITRCWDDAPEQRPTFAEILADADSFKVDLCDEKVFNEYRSEVLKLP
jgi:hypothetical protein